MVQIWTLFFLFMLNNGQKTHDHPILVIHHSESHSSYFRTRKQHFWPKYHNYTIFFLCLELQSVFFTDCLRTDLCLSVAYIWLSCLIMFPRRLQVRDLTADASCLTNMLRVEKSPEAQNRETEDECDIFPLTGVVNFLLWKKKM